MIVDPTAPSHSSGDEVQLFRKHETLKCEKHVLDGASMLPLVMTSFGKLGLLLRVTCRVLQQLRALQELLTVACGCVLLGSS
jgi:hypothetical protein